MFQILGTTETFERVRHTKMCVLKFDPKQGNLLYSILALLINSRTLKLIKVILTNLRIKKIFFHPIDFNFARVKSINLNLIQVGLK